MTPIPTALSWLVIALVGLCVGSFLSVVVTRLPAGGAIVRGRSACPQCQRQLALADLLPLLSWLRARGRCRHCGAAISPLYPALEVAAMLLALWAFAIVPGWLAWVTCLLGWTLLALAALDLREFWLPDILTLPLVPAGLLVALALDGTDLLGHVIGAIVGFLAMVLLRWLYQRLRGREGLGLGDAKLMAAAGAWLSWPGLPSVLLIAAAAGLLGELGKRLGGRPLALDAPLAFGPYLALGFWLVWLYGPLVPPALW